MTPLITRSRDVSPPTPALDVRHCALIYAEIFGDQALKFLRLTSPDYLCHVGRSYLGVPVLFSSGAASFAAHVLTVVFGSSYKQVIGPNTGCIVAVVQAIQAFRDWAICQLVGGTMRELYDRPFASATDVDAPVAMCGYTGFPDPAPVCFLYLSP